MQGQSTARSCMHHVNAGFAQLSAIRSLVSACGLDYIYNIYVCCKGAEIRCTSGGKGGRIEFRKQNSTRHCLLLHVYECLW